jgi:pantothenate kinase type III
MILLFDIGNTHTHLGLADDRRVLKQTDISDADVVRRRRGGASKKFCGQK